ncbi:MAG: DEAD/DEAH box helicase, partial [Deltaproteobacteria bacterium]|nr:DEAD/DEAH box helicase [Deltaproteobacteria bacterium]
IGVHWAIAVFDEAQKIKNPKARVTDMAKSIKAELTLTLTGTPVENSLADLWCIADAVQLGRLQTLKEFAGRFMPGGKPGQEELSDLKNELDFPTTHSLMLRRSKEEHWHERPDKHECLHEVIMPEEQALYYTAVIEKAQHAKGKKGAMLEALQSLRAVSLHPSFQQEHSGNGDEFIHKSARLIALFNILDDLSSRGEKALIFIEYLKMQAAISEIIERRYDCPKVMIINGQVSGAKRQAHVDEFQNRREGFEVMILSPKAGGVGINLTAATHVIHLSRWWNPAVEDQCSDRAYTS